MITPLEQFNIITYFNIYLPIIGRMNFTNITIYLIVILMLIIIITRIYFNINISKNKEWEIVTNNKIRKNRITNIMLMIFSFWEEQVKEMLGTKGYKYLPLIQSLFIIILICNLIGLIPYSYTITSQYIVCVTLSIIIFAGVTILGIYKHKLKFITLFIPSGVPIFILPLISFIEVISYFSRVLSLSLRLCINNIAGHCLLKIIANLGSKFPIILYFAPIFLLLALFVLELGVCFIQAYVFTILSLIYIKDVQDINH